MNLECIQQYLEFTVDQSLSVCIVGSHVHVSSQRASTLPGLQPLVCFQTVDPTPHQNIKARINVPSKM